MVDKKLKVKEGNGIYIMEDITALDQFIFMMVSGFAGVGIYFMGSFFGYSDFWRVLFSTMVAAGICGTFLLSKMQRIA